MLATINNQKILKIDLPIPRYNHNQLETFAMKILNKLSVSAHIKKIDRKIESWYLPKKLTDIGLIGVGKNQPRAALVYLISPFLRRWDYPRPNETNIKLLLSILLEKGYVVDIYDFNHALQADRSQLVYDLIFGFGQCFDILCEINDQAQKVMFAVEMPPWQMQRVEAEAVQDIRALGIRSSKINKRSGVYYTNDNFKNPDQIIAMGSAYQKEIIRSRYAKTIEMIDCSAPVETLNYIKTAPKDPKSFAWIGSNGAAMKGLHKILPLFQEHEDFQLHLFGLSKPDKKFLKPFSNNNILDHGFVDLRDRDFQKTISKQAAVISASYSEGMQTSIATALCLGTRAIVTPHCGYTNRDIGITITSHEKLGETLQSFHKNAEFELTDENLLAIRHRYSANTFKANVEKTLDKFGA